jgi:hypothetical protein
MADDPTVGPEEVRAALEPIAAHSYVDLDYTIQFSQAISAKRQADALEAQAEHLAHIRRATNRIADAFDQQSATGNVLYWLEMIASAANASVGR